MKNPPIIIAFFADTAFAHDKPRDGVIYKQHPHIDVIRTLATLYEEGDADEMAKYFDAGAQFIGMSRYQAGESRKKLTLADAVAGWKEIIDNWHIKMTESISPQGLQYVADPFTVQSWWLISVVNKKTGKKAEVDMVLFDLFNAEGKIITQHQYYDPAPLIEAAK